MITLNLTHTQADEILHALRTSYADYNEKLGTYYNESIASYNKQLDELIGNIKQQLKDQEDNL